MKRRILIVLFVLTASTTMAQYDTIYSRCDRYYYAEWYDQCFLYDKIDTINGGYTLSSASMTVTDQPCNNTLMLNEHYITGGMAVKGISAMVVMQIDSTVSPGGITSDTLTEKLPEYLMIFQGDSAMTPPITTTAFPRHMVLIDSVRWDTAAPSIMRLPKIKIADTNDPTNWMTCLVYEAYFPTPIMVDSFFYLAGTVHSNIRTMAGTMLYSPTHYTYVREYNLFANDCHDCDQNHDVYSAIYPLDECPWYYWYNLGYNAAAFGPFLPIVDFYQLSVSSNDDMMGSVDGGGRYPAMSTVTVRAIPENGYIFLQWGDGLTDNPRQVEMSADTVLTAIFLPND